MNVEAIILDSLLCLNMPVAAVNWYYLSLLLLNDWFKGPFQHQFL